MAGKKQLPPVRVAVEGEKPGPESRLDKLIKMQSVLEAHIHSENTLARDLSPLVRQAREISKEIEELESASKPDALDEAADTDDARFDPGEI